MCVTNNVCKNFAYQKCLEKCLQRKCSFPLFFPRFFLWRKRSVWIFYAKNSPLVANDFYYGVANYFLCCDCYRREICCCQIEKERWLPSSMSLLLCLLAMLIGFNRVAWKFCWFPKILKYSPTSKIDLFQKMFLKFWMIFAKSLSFVYDKNFS